MTSYTLYIILDPRVSHPQHLLEQWIDLYQADSGSYTQVYEDNLEELLERHTGGEDIPSGSKEIIKKAGTSPFTINRKHFQKVLRNRVLYQWELFNCSRFPDQEESLEDIELGPEDQDFLFTLFSKS